MTDLANAPMIDTDIPTSDAYLTHQSLSTSTVDVTRKYCTTRSNSSIVSMDNVPNTFARDSAQKGIIAVFSSYLVGGSQSLRVAIHKPTAVLREYATAWDVLNNVSLSVPASDANTSYVIAGCVASQRQGQYAYVFMHLTRFGLFTDTREVDVYKVTRDEYVEQTGRAGGDQVLSGGSSTFATTPIVSALDNGQFFVSDEEQPFIWNVTGTCHDGGQASTTGFRDDDSGDIGFSLADGSGTVHYYGQSAAYLQRLTLPAGSAGYGPILVHPWSAGAYGTPQLWFFLTEIDPNGNTTGRFLVYRSEWKKGEYRKPSDVTFGDDPDYAAGETAFPRLNPLGYGWEQSWLDQDHSVGAVGPVQSVPMWNPGDSPLARLQNDSNSTVGAPLGAPAGGDATALTAALPLGIGVVRDKKRYGMMHLVIGDGGGYPRTVNAINRIWFANSSDDGATWSRMSQIGPYIAPASQGTPSERSLGIYVRSDIPTQRGLMAEESVKWTNANGGAVSSLNLVRTHDDVLLLGNFARFTNYVYPDGTTVPLTATPADFGAKCALAVIDYTGIGAGVANKTAVVFVRQATRGAISWQ